ncbi:MAG TPA: hypothetical protein VK553_10070 [Candidatus Nitrosopolaris rasttigaisensis]|jgi:hypothetical protein|nr:hypothetical protein [Candidatus Nitrosopolaris rasttigaisensis]
MTIIIILLFTYLANLLNIQPVYATGDDKQNVADIFVFGSGIFAAFLFALSLLAYRNLLTKRLLLVSAAFGIFAIHAIVSKLDLFTPLHIESSVLEMTLAIMNFVALAFIFLAIVKRAKIKTKTPTPRSHS